MKLRFLHATNNKTWSLVDHDGFVWRSGAEGLVNYMEKEGSVLDRDAQRASRQYYQGYRRVLAKFKKYGG